MIDITERLVRFAGKLCLSTDTEVEAAAEIDRLRKLIRDTNTYYAECIAEREDYRAANEKLRMALKPFADAYRNEEFEYSPIIFKSSELRAAAEAIRDETE